MINLSWSPLDSTIELLDVSDVDDSLRLTVKSNRESSSCPACHHVSSRFFCATMCIARSMLASHARWRFKIMESCFV
jgi:hypothetical protein